MRVVVGAVVAVLIVGIVIAVSQSGSHSSSYTNASEIATRLKSRAPEAGCEEPEAGDVSALDGAQSEESCDSVDILVFGNGSDLNSFMQTTAEVPGGQACDEQLIRGSNWIAEVTADDNVTEVRNAVLHAVGGNVFTVKC